MRIILQNDNPKVSRQELRDASRYMYRLLVTNDNYKRTTIRIVSKVFKKNCYAVVEPNKKRKPIYTIYLNTKYSRKKQLSSLAHELVHVKQFITEELGGSWEHEGDAYTNWQGKSVSESRVYYSDLPWEIDAWGRQYGLYKRYERFKMLKVRKHTT